MNWCKTIDPNNGFDAAKIVAQCGLVPEQIRFCGIYFLLDGETVVYVGQSINVPGRVYTHRTEKRFDFQLAKYLPVIEEELDDAEVFFIGYFRPKYNRSKHALHSKKGRKA